MSWNRRYLIVSYLQSSLWIIPLCAIVLEAVTTKIVRGLDAKGGWELIGLGIEGAKAVMNAVVTLSLSFIVFTFGSLLVAIQVASGQYTPRIIATTLLRDNLIRCTVGVFVFTFVFAVKALNRVEATVPEVAAFGVALLG